MRPTVERLLAFLPESHLKGLGAVVLTQAAVSHRRKRRVRRTSRHGIRLAEYHPAWKGEAAWIELVVDEIAKDLSKPLSSFRVLCDVVVGRVLFHEIGHHLDATVGSVGRTGEHGAEAWRRRLLSGYLQQRHRYLRLLRPALRVLYRFATAMAARKRRRRNTG